MIEITLLGVTSQLLLRACNDLPVGTGTATKKKVCWDGPVAKNLLWAAKGVLLRSQIPTTTSKFHSSLYKLVIVILQESPCSVFFASWWRYCHIVICHNFPRCFGKILKVIKSSYKSGTFLQPFRPWRFSCSSRLAWTWDANGYSSEI